MECIVSSTNAIKELCDSFGLYSLQSLHTQIAQLLLVTNVDGVNIARFHVTNQTQ